uniref:Uncharacterized protein n=1 Tax=Helianthus annuus TaxID=4232 RepID=A0A251TKB0_HELAN
MKKMIKFGSGARHSRCEESLEMFKVYVGLESLHDRTFAYFISRITSLVRSLGFPNPYSCAISRKSHTQPMLIVEVILQDETRFRVD